MNNIDIIKDEKYQEWDIEFNKIFICRIAYNKESDYYYEYRDYRYGVENRGRVGLEEFEEVFEAGENNVGDKSYLAVYYDEELSFIGSIEDLFDFHLKHYDLESDVDYGEMVIDEEAKKIIITYESESL